MVNEKIGRDIINVSKPRGRGLVIIMERCWQNMYSKAKIIVGAVVEKDGKYLLVQEAKEKCRGKWNLPAGHLDPNETIMAAAKREVKEETGYDVTLTGVCQIGSRVSADEIFVSIIFKAEILDGEIAFDTKEILDVKWFSYDEVLAMRSELRNEGMVLGAIDNTRKGLVASLDVVRRY